ncbi:hypothetical protein AVEN_4405-1 [Araneus ventricosus]|uniref:Uncharacterized protein n=1 Tax=Araneus ventricosus TaxID=182803 RepID=A0A4Y2WW01_ARAVE|nr:hypothetical protein AVEN_4405-1 [Araneus ventricosus]
MEWNTGECPAFLRNQQQEIADHKEKTPSSGVWRVSGAEGIAPVDEKFFAGTLPTDFSERGRGGLVVKSWLWGRRVQGSKPESTEDTLNMGPAAHQIIRSDQTSSRWCGVEACRGGASSSVVLAIWPRFKVTRSVPK